LGTNSRKNEKFEEQTELVDFMEINQSLATTVIQTLCVIEASRSNPIQTVSESKDKEPKFQPTSSTNTSMF
jgi:hypothetical protein